MSNDNGPYLPSLPDEPELPPREPLDDLLDHIGAYAVLSGELDGRYLRAYLALCGYEIRPTDKAGSR